MGNNTFKDMKDPSNTNNLGQIIDIEDLFAKNCFEKQYVVGKGGFGKVWKVQSKKQYNQSYALKEMQKSRIIARKSLNAVLMERTILSKLNHPFLVNMKAAFQDRESLYLVLDYCSGGDLRYHLPHKHFNEEETRFMVASMLLSLEYLHELGIVHRDIKPENLVFDEKGYLMLTDFGISRQFPINTVKDGGISEPSAFDNILCGIIDTSGTPGYMSPEAMCKLPHGPVSDYFAVGVILYEMMFRRRPYSGASKQAIRDSMLAKQVQIRAHEIPNEWSIEAADFCNKMIRRKPQSRLGFMGGIQEVKNHPWFQDFDWNNLLQKKMNTPWQPPKGDNYKGKNIEFPQNEALDSVFIEAEQLCRRDTVQKLFEGYYYEAQNFIRYEVTSTKKRINFQNVRETQSLLKKSRNIIQSLNNNKGVIVSPAHHINKVQKINILDLKDKNFKVMQQNHQAKSPNNIKYSSNSSGSTGVSSLKSSTMISQNSGVKYTSLPKLGSPKQAFQNMKQL